MQFSGDRWTRLFAAMLAASLAQCGARVAPSDTDRAVRLLAAGVGQTCAVDTRDAVWCWGFVGGTGELAARPPTLLDTVPGVEELVPGQASVCVRTTDGRVSCAGVNVYGQLGAAGDDRDSFAAVPGVDDAVQLVYSRGRYCALRRDGGLLCWGAVLHVAEDRGSWRTRVYPVTRVDTGGPLRRLLSVNANGLCVERRSGELACESSDAIPERAMLARLQLIEGDNIEPIVGANGERCERRASALRCGTTVIEGLPSGLRPLFVTSNAAGMCGALDGAMLCKTPGQDARVPPLRPSAFDGWSVADLPTFTSIATSYDFGCAVAPDRRAFCWGRDAIGALGQGLPRNTIAPRRVDLGASPARRLLSWSTVVGFDREVVRFRGAPSNVADELRAPSWDPFAAAHLQREVLFAGEVFTDVVSIFSIDCAFGARTRCRDSLGAISEPFGDDGATTRSLALEHAGLARIRRDGRVEATFSLQQLGREAPVLLPFTDVVSVAVDISRICAVDTGNVLRCIGGEFPGTTDRPPTAPPAVIATDVRSVQRIADGTCYIDTRGRPFCWGTNAGWIFDPDSFQPVATPRQIEIDQPVRALSVGAGMILALTDDGRVYCRGNNAGGECGRPSSARRVGWSRVEGIDDVVAVQGLGAQSCALRRDGSVWCWGLTSGGQTSFGHQPRSDRAVFVELRARP
jgi:alpha-tubulin suppressor-like RCC1 family protein